jgi:predicted nucleic acid-binding Zn ribbon protein
MGKRRSQYQAVYLPPQAVPLGEILGHVLDGIGLGKKDPLVKVRAKWERVVGAETAAHSRITAYRKKTLYVTVDSSALLQELSVFKKKEIAERMKAAPNVFFVGEIRFKLGRLE